jgi:tetratricopeptide (TPR) repeat protein
MTEMINSINHLQNTIIISRSSELARRGRLQEAALLLASIADQENQDPAVYDLMAKIYAQQGSFDKARSYWELALLKNPKNKEYLKAIKRCNSYNTGYSRFQSFKAIKVGAFLLMCIVALYFIYSNWSETQTTIHSLNEEINYLQDLIPEEEALPDYKILVENILYEDPVFSAMDLDIRQHGLVITVSGEVPDLITRYELENRLGMIGGVEALDYRGLTITDAYEVIAGDTLWNIAERVYGNPYLWPKIAEANWLQPPYALEIGQKLIIPLSGNKQ